MHNDDNNFGHQYEAAKGGLNSEEEKKPFMLKHTMTKTLIDWKSIFRKKHNKDGDFGHQYEALW